jgi:hypothetical protein
MLRAYKQMLFNAEATDTSTSFVSHMLSIADVVEATINWDMYDTPEKAAITERSFCGCCKTRW